MRKSLRRWLLQQRTPKLKPLYQRTSWYDFEGRMHRALAIDIALLLGEVSRAELAEQARTRELPACHDAPTEIAPAGIWWLYSDETECVACGVDAYATEPIVAR